MNDAIARGYNVSNHLIGSNAAGQQAATAAVPPDFLIKYEPLNEPSAPGGHEEPVHGNESEAVDRIRKLVESGRTTPGRVSLYANVNPHVEVAVTFPNRGVEAPARR